MSRGRFGTSRSLSSVLGQGSAPADRGHRSGAPPRSGSPLGTGR
ncbi:MAG TPA: hypothetical protein VMV49_15000 [Candidatus Deferrimicrobium sp.]|nr:hypothetical protein [Candidatus Deferrimicrobium sp.]